MSFVTGWAFWRTSDHRGNMTKPSLTSDRWSRILAVVLPLIGTILFYALLSSQEPTPFSYKGDMHILAAPMARFAAEGWSSFHVPLIDWSLGDGFNPWLSGQSSVLYPIYPAALLIAKGLGEPALLLEATAFLDFLILAYVLMGSPFFRKWSLWQRILVSLLFLAQPSGIILGQNWCYFLNSYVWLVLTAHWLLAWGRWPTRTRYAWLTVGSLLVFYTAINVQMFAFAVALALLPILIALRQRIPWQSAAAFMSLVAVLLLPSMLLLLAASKHSNPAWMRGRETVDAALAFAQSFSGVLSGVVAGNLVMAPFQIWSGVSWQTVGIFWMAPLLPWALTQVPSRQRRPLLWGLLGLGVLLGIASFPFLKWLFIGPFARFRWTWKFAIFIPVFLLAALALRSTGRMTTRGTWVMALSVLLGVTFCLRGLKADFMPALRPIADLGSIGLLDPGVELTRVLALKPGERIAPVGRMRSLADQVPMAWLAFAGNGPSLFGVPTLAIYEPLEAAQQAEFRGGLTLPWREALDDHMTLQAFQKVDAHLGPIGVRYYLFKSQPEFEGPGQREVRFKNGERIWVVASQCWQPWVRNAQGEAGLNPNPDGTWRLPPGGPWRIATSRTMHDAQGTLVSGGTWIPGDSILTPSPLAPWGRWVGGWYLGLGGIFLISWLASPGFRGCLGLAPPASLWAGLRDWHGAIWIGTILTVSVVGTISLTIWKLCFN